MKARKSELKALPKTTTDYLDEMVEKGMKEDMFIHFTTEYKRCSNYPGLRNLCKLSLEYLGFELVTYTHN